MDVDILQIDREEAADFLIVCVKQVEADAIDSQLTSVCTDSKLHVKVEGREYKLGKIGNYNVVCCRCKDPGTIGPNSVTLTVVSALQDWPGIKGVFMPGICYGVKGEGDGGQHISDVVASEKVFAYESQEKGESINYKTKKDTVFTANRNLVNAFEEANSEWNYINRFDEETRIYKGTYVSGNTRFTDDKPIAELREAYPHATVGDMEGHGLASACKRFNMPWLLMKGISDFGKREEDDNERQKDAALASAKALLNILNSKNSEHINAVIPGGSVNFYYHGVKQHINDIFFRQYKPDVEKYYIERNIDKILVKLVKTGCCWVYGESGVGKSVSISRALRKNNIPFVLCELTRYLHQPVEDIFKHIYGKICIFTNEKPSTQIHTFDQIVNEIFEVVKKYFPNQELYVLIEEIPFNFDSDQFRYFFEKLNAMIISCDLNLGNSRIQFILSTIDSPKSKIDQWQKKVNNRMRYIGMDKWTMEECKALTDLLSRSTNLTWEEKYTQEAFIEGMDYSPARIKKVLNDLVSIDANIVNKDNVDLVNLI